MSITGFNKRRREMAERGWETESGNTERQEAKKEPTFNELRQQAKGREIEGYGKMTKGQLLEALRG